jgi:phosphoglycolate phosphatase
LAEWPRDHDQPVPSPIALVVLDTAGTTVADAGQLVAMPGAAYAIEMLRESGIKVALCTGFSAQTQQCIVETLGWHDIADLSVLADESQPNPAITAARELGIQDAALVATVGDTAYDIHCGREAGAKFVAGVLTGAHSADRLRAAGATHLLQAAMSLPEFITPARR